MKKIPYGAHYGSYDRLFTVTACLHNKKDRAYARSNLSILFPFLFLQEFHFRTEGILDD
jgi:hypothetical protein